MYYVSASYYEGNNPKKGLLGYVWRNLNDVNVSNDSTYQGKGQQGGQNIGQQGSQYSAEQKGVNTKKRNGRNNGSWLPICYSWSKK